MVYLGFAPTCVVEMADMITPMTSSGLKILLIGLAGGVGTSLVASDGLDPGLGFFSISRTTEFSKDTAMTSPYVLSSKRSTTMPEPEYGFLP